jgi:hypothetical protein
MASPVNQHQKLLSGVKVWSKLQLRSSLQLGHAWKVLWKKVRWGQGLLSMSMSVSPLCNENNPVDGGGSTNTETEAGSLVA